MVKEPKNNLINLNFSKDKWIIDEFRSLFVKDSCFDSGASLSYEPSRLKSKYKKVKMPNFAAVIEQNNKIATGSCLVANDITHMKGGKSLELADNQHCQKRLQVLQIT